MEYPVVYGEHSLQGLADMDSVPTSIHMKRDGRLSQARYNNMKRMTVRFHGVLSLGEGFAT
jgi:hypothetical protein